MVIQAYIRVLSDEATIHAIQREANVSKVSVKRLEARRGKTGGERWWDWGTDPTAIDPDKADDEIKAMLRRHRPIFPFITKHLRPDIDIDIYLEIVVRYAEDDDPRGLCLSAETVLLVSELGGAVDIDVVPLLGKF
jgi:hypothetical protein